ncbi:MAG: DUF1810 domain-containing protein [Paracoccaceae bacterium]
MEDDPHDLARFEVAQAGVIEDAFAELKAGRKRTHWMWFVFPQLAGLGRSETARRYAISGAPEARAYLAHPTLGPRLLAGIEAAAASGETDMTRLFGAVDAAKFRSCLTLFREAAAEGGERAPFARALEFWYDGEPCAATLERL